MSTSWTSTSTGSAVAEALNQEIRGKNVIITGVTIGGLGFTAAETLAAHANLVILAGSSMERCQSAISLLGVTNVKSLASLDQPYQTILANNPKANLRKLVLNLASLKSVRTAAEIVNAYPEPIHVLINNANATVTSEISLSEEGYERQFAVGHLGASLFTVLIMPRLRAARDTNNDGGFLPRILNVSSITHSWAEAIDFDDINYKKNPTAYKKWGAYARVKLSNILFTKELARRLEGEGIITFSVYPGGIPTNGAANATLEEAVAMGILNPDGTPTPRYDPFKTLDQGVATYMVAAFDPRLKDISGAYISDDCQPHPDELSKYASDPHNAIKLWELTEELVGEKYLSVHEPAT